MNHRDFIYVGLALIFLVWISGASLPYKLQVIEEAPRVSYDTYISSQEFILEKKLAQLQKSKSNTGGSIIDLKEQLAHVLWSMRRLDDALKQYKEIEAARKKWSDGYDQKLIGTMISIAGLYRDLDRLDDSIDYYEQIWRLDKSHLPANDIRLARDQTSMAVIGYVCGETQRDDKIHKKFMNNCIAHIDLAQKILGEQLTPQTARLANLMYLKWLAFRSLDEKVASKECKQAADYLTKKLNRPYMLPWS
jgi:tetratricopeptide (TPR) repeat protein